jgi:hypothetical protein
VRRKVGDTTLLAHWDLTKDKGGFPKATGKLGKNQPSLMFRALATRCAFSDAARFTARSARRTGISLMCKSGTNQHIVNAKARHSNTATNSLYCDPHSDEYAAAAVALHYKPEGKYIVIDSILHTFVYSLLELYAANLALDDSKENLSPDSDFEQKMAPSISPPVLEQKPAPVDHIPASMSACAPIAQGYHPTAPVVAQAPNPYALMPAPATFQTQYFSAPPTHHPGYQPAPQAQPAVYYQPQAPPMQYMAPQPMYHPYPQPAPQQAFSLGQPPPSSAFPTQQHLYYQVPQVHYPSATLNPPTGGV